jgi:type IV pilus assembly protein PilV
VKTTGMKVSSQLSQRGIVLLDALIAIVIFSIGILGMVSLQGAAIKLAGDAQYRTNAAMLADQVISQMWTGNVTSASDLSAAYAGASGTGGPQYTAWLNTINCATANASTNCLPGVTAATNAPVITIVPNAAFPKDALVTVTVNWQAPNDTGPHNYVSITQIGP